MRSAPRRRRGLRIVGLAALPGALVLKRLAFRYPELTERWYGEGVYPLVARGLGVLSGRVEICVGEIAVAVVALAALALGLLARARRDGTRVRRGGRWRRRLARAWAAAGVGLLAFELLWGLNYARPPLAERLGLAGVPVDEALLERAAARAATAANAWRTRTGAPVDAPLRLSVSLAALGRIVDARYGELALPGTRLGGPLAPPKRLASSVLFAYLGVSGLYLPPTGEPAVNGLVPDASLPVVVAHEKAHQRGVTDEGEASLAAFLVCTAEGGPDEIAYAGYLFAAARLLGALARTRPEEASAVWARLGEGPRRDLEAIRAFWSRYEGAAARVAERVNDAYLRSQRVAGGTESYGRVVRLLLALEATGRLVPAGSLRADRETARRDRPSS